MEAGSSNSLKVMAKRREATRVTSSERSYLNKRIAKIIRQNIWSANTRLNEAIEQNTGSKQLRKRHLMKLMILEGNTAMSGQHIFAEIENF